MGHIHVSAILLISLSLWSALDVIYCQDEVQLTFLENSHVYGNVYHYISRCSVPCTGSYQAGEMQVTFTYDKAVYNLYTFGHFRTDQESPRRVWEVTSTTWLHENSRGLCEFDVQVEHTHDTTVPQGACRIGWDPPPCEDEPGVIVAGLTCTDIRYDELHRCYSSSVFDQCCYSCSKFRMDLPNCEYGDRAPARCNISDQECYDQTTNSRCCMTCGEIEQDRQGAFTVPNCPYGNRLSDFVCNNFNRTECYTMDEDCCDTCFWLAEDQYPDCLYGDRRNCDLILNRDCYNTTTARECCEVCHGLKDDLHPGCEYGDRDQRCNRIERKDCYNTNNNDTCCSTCREFANLDFVGCEYGDRENCDNVTRTQCENSDNLQYTCCEKCTFLTANSCPRRDEDYCEFGLYRHECYDTATRRECCQYCYSEYDGSMAAFECGYGDRDDDCWFNTWSEDCYTRRVRQNCCDTCAALYRAELPDNCKFGDRTPNDCYQISGIECYDNVTQRDCCEQCSYWEVADNPYHCRYGDRSERCYRIAPFDCYDAATERECCETCPYTYQLDNYSYACRYGDKADYCYMSPYRECYDASFRGDCCRYCDDSANKDIPGCIYGDRLARCSNLTVGECYDLEAECCATCPDEVIHIVIENCKYGDRDARCSEIEAADCYNATIARTCCLTCYYLRESSQQLDCPFGDRASDCASIDLRDCYIRQNDCCDTCKQYVIPDHVHIDDCDYGDRGQDCADIYDHQCYNMYRERECCETCYNRRNLVTTAADCLYGDRISQCLDPRRHSSECYNVTKRSLCCQTCENIKTDNPNCLYGDQNVVCETIVPSSTHLCYTLQTACCDTCPQYRDDNSPGCEYGDLIPDCYKSECDRYSAFNLQRCCHTCRDHVTPGPTSYSPSSYTVSTGETTAGTTRGPEVTQTPDKQSGTPTLRPMNTTINAATTHAGLQPRPSPDQPSGSSPSPVSNQPRPRPNPTPSHPPGTRPSDNPNHPPGLRPSNNPDRPPGARPKPNQPPRTRPDSSEIETTYAPITTTVAIETPNNDLEKIVDALGSIGPIVGGVVGGVLLIIIIVGVACYIMRRNRGEKQSSRHRSQPLSSAVAYNSGSQPKDQYRPHSYHSGNAAPAYNRYPPQPSYNNSRNPPHAAHDGRNSPHTANDGRKSPHSSNDGRNPPNKAKPNSYYPPQQGLSNGRNPVPQSNGNKASGGPMQDPLPKRPELQRQSTKDEVYDYIHPDDVKSVISEPAFRPALPERDLPEEGYLEPGGGKASVASDYSNRGYQKDGAEGGDQHTYHILQKDATADHQYSSM